MTRVIKILSVVLALNLCAYSQMIETDGPLNGKRSFTNLFAEITWDKYGSPRFTTKYSADEGLSWNDILIGSSDDHFRNIFEQSESVIDLSRVLKDISPECFHFPTNQKVFYPEGLLFTAKINNDAYAGGTGRIMPGKSFPGEKFGAASNPDIRTWRIRKDWGSLPPGPLRDTLEDDYLNWPVDRGAPWVDKNKDGSFTAGTDEPEFLGDEVIFTIYDNVTLFRVNSENSPLSPILEIHSLAFEFDDNDQLGTDQIKIFKVFNKSPYQLEDFVLGYYADNHSIEGNDFLMGCDTSLDLGYILGADSSQDRITYPAGFVLLSGSRGKPGGLLKSFGVNYILNPSNIFDGKLVQGSYEKYEDCRESDKRTKLISGTCSIDGTAFINRRYYVSTNPFDLEDGEARDVALAILSGNQHIERTAIEALKQKVSALKRFYRRGFVGITKSEDGRISKLAPPEFEINLISPDPFSSVKKIEFSVPDTNNSEAFEIRISLLNMEFERIHLLIDEKLKPGRYEKEIDMKMADIPAGYFYCVLEANNKIKTGKMISKDNL